MNKLAIGVSYQDKSNTRRWKAAIEDRRDRGNVWFIPYDTVQSNIERPHPATFPVRLPEMCIKLHGVSDENMLVVDPFCGIGSTAVACKRLGVSFVGFDIDKEYLNEAVNRVKSEEQRLEEPMSNSSGSHSGLFVVDRSKFMRFELKEPRAEEFSEAIGFVVYSNSKVGVDSSMVFFELLWNEHIQYEKLREYERLKAVQKMKDER